jgi:hypothetical protein
MKLAYIDSCIWITRFEGLSTYKNIIMHELQHLAQTGWRPFVRQKLFGLKYS